MSNEPLLRVENLKKYFPIRKGVFSRVAAQVKAVDDISFRIDKGETLGLVGESGCGKTTAGRSVLRIIEPTSGEVRFQGVDVLSLAGQELRDIRKHMQIIFQDPYGSLNPRMTVGAIVGEGLVVHKMGTRKEWDERVKELLEIVGLSPNHIHRYAHEFSGGQRQRIGIARALALDPAFVVCDEAVSALDVSIQAQIINLLVKLREERNLSYLFIAHDLSVVEYISDRVAVMYLGKLCEVAGPDELYANAAHPYTALLLGSNPEPDPSTAVDEDLVDDGELPSPIHPPSGCRFRTRCPHASDRCSAEEPQMREVRPGHHVACHYPLIAVAG